jgi:hypothetical protein
MRFVRILNRLWSRWSVGLRFLKLFLQTRSFCSKALIRRFILSRDPCRLDPAFPFPFPVCGAAFWKGKKSGFEYSILVRLFEWLFLPKVFTSGTSLRRSKCKWNTMKKGYCNESMGKTLSSMWPNIFLYVGSIIGNNFLTCQKSVCHSVRHVQFMFILRSPSGLRYDLRWLEKQVKGRCSFMKGFSLMLFAYEGNLPVCSYSRTKEAIEFWTQFGPYDLILPRLLHPPNQTS